MTLFRGVVRDSFVERMQQAREKMRGRQTTETELTTSLSERVSLECKLVYFWLNKELHS